MFDQISRHSGPENVAHKIHHCRVSVSFLFDILSTQQSLNIQSAILWIRHFIIILLFNILANTFEGILSNGK